MQGTADFADLAVRNILYFSHQPPLRHQCDLSISNHWKKEKLWDLFKSHPDCMHLFTAYRTALIFSYLILYIFIAVI